jgi:hypothetical protein
VIDTFGESNERISAVADVIAAISSLATLAFLLVSTRIVYLEYTRNQQAEKINALSILYSKVNQLSMRVRLYNRSKPDCDGYIEDGQIIEFFRSTIELGIAVGEMRDSLYLNAIYIGSEKFKLIQIELDKIGDLIEVITNISDTFTKNKIGDTSDHDAIPNEISTVVLVDLNEIILNIKNIITSTESKSQ